MRILLLLGIVAVLPVMPASAAGQAETLAEALALAQAYDHNLPPSDVEKDADTAIYYYRRALELRPDHPDNMPLLATIGGMLLSMDGNRDRQLEGLAIFEEMLETFEYMDYYQEHPDYRANSAQYKMLAVAVHAGETYQFLLRDPEKARPFYFKGMELLNQTYWRRLEDWRAQPAPPKPKEGPFVGELELSKWKSRVHMWEERQRIARSGEMFREGLTEAGFVKSLVRKYLETYGKILPGETESILQPIIEAFPGSPFEKEARRVIAMHREKADAYARHVSAKGIAEYLGDLSLSETEPIQQASLENRGPKAQDAVQVPAVAAEKSATTPLGPVLAACLVLVAGAGAYGAWRWRSRRASKAQ